MHVTTRENDKEKENNKTNLHSAVTGRKQLRAAFIVSVCHLHHINEHRRAFLATNG